ncbi:MAG TPA: DUF504 domain-containing protein [Casimicrobiaceae bacterium]
MIPIQALLSRIRWDEAFGQARFEIDYYDRVEKKLVHVPLERVLLSDGQRFFLDVIAPDGAVHSVPLHRVRAVWRDGVMIWQRKRAASPISE